MRFALDEEQLAFSRSLDDLLNAADVPSVTRAWGNGDTAAGMKLWRQLAELGVHALRIPEEQGGLGATAVDLTVAFEGLGYHAVPGPYLESVALAPSLLSTTDGVGAGSLTAIAEGTEVVSVAAPPTAPFALDADIASEVLLLDGNALRRATVGTLHRSVDAARRLFTVTPGEAVAETGSEAARAGLDTAALACSAQLFGAGERLLAESVEYAKNRTQFGHPIGEYQSLKHALANVKVGLDFARPLVHAAAISLDAESGDAPRDVSAAKVASSDAAYLAARTALQTHGAIGYTLEHDLGLWITKVRALVGAWGTTTAHRDRVLAAIS